MDLRKYFADRKEVVDNLLISFISRKQKENQYINRWTSDYSSRLKSFVTNGKALRAGLVCLAYRIIRDEDSDEAVKAGAAVELMHSSLLIHDDIMDQDLLRRGLPTIHAQYSQLAKDEKIRSPDHFGESMAICIGDVSLFYTFELLSTLNVDSEKKSRIINLYAKELTAVATAQMQDLYAGLSNKDVSDKDILNVYYYKSARYTYSLPLIVGAIIAEADNESISTLDRIGESLGVIFQIKDDELGLFGDEKETGKPVGSDIKEGKQTLYYYYLFKACSGQEKERLRDIFGSNSLASDDITLVRSLVMKYGIDKTIQKRVDALVLNAKQEIASLKIKEEYRDMLFDMIEHALKRKR